jgi:hypothetical protein
MNDGMILQRSAKIAHFFASRRKGAFGAHFSSTTPHTRHKKFLLLPEDEDDEQ